MLFCNKQSIMMNSKLTFSHPIHALIMIFTLASCMQHDTQKALAKINADSLKARIRFISDDKTAGREPGSKGSLIALQYISNQMQQIGLKPGMGDTSYYQHFNLVKVDVGKDLTLSFKGQHKDLNPSYYDDYIVFPGQQKEKISIRDADLVFAGYGIQAPEFNWDDFRDTDVRGKFILIMNNDPDTGNPEFFGGKARLYYGRWDYKYEQAARMGAAGAIIIHTTESAAYPWSVVQTSWTGSQYQLAQDSTSGLACKAWVTENVAGQLAEMAGYKLADLQHQAQKPGFKPIPLGIKVNCTMEAGFTETTGTNVLGILPGSDPELSKQAVIITAHHDHLGIGKVINGDSIYNGAIDNAAGVASILTLADAFAGMKKVPRRTLVFISIEGEESGLIGSWYYAHHPTFPPEAIAANINLDFANVWGRTRDVVSVGYGTSGIDAVVDKYAGEQGRTVKPDLEPERGMFYRSDQFNFAKIGVPVLYLSVGQDFIGKPGGWGKDMMQDWIKVNYHQPTDEYNPDWDMSGQIEDLNLLFRVITDIADADRMPEWKPGAEFEKFRKKN
jgi:hypothetical protein